MGTNYCGKKLINEEQLKQIGIRENALYSLFYTTEFPTAQDRTTEENVLGKNLLTRLQNLNSKGNVRIKGPIKFVGEEQ
jgi:hypothetical protein